MKKTITRAAITVALVLAVASPATATAPIVRDIPTPIPMKLPPTLGSTFIILHDKTPKGKWPVAQAAKDWNKSLDSAKIKQIRFGHTKNRTCKAGPNVICVPISQTKGCPTKKATCWGAAFNSVIRINDGKYYSVPKWIRFNDQTPNPIRGCAVRHEMGHAIGLRHSEDPSSLMYPVCQNAYPKKMPNINDLKALRNAYE